MRLLLDDLVEKSRMYTKFGKLAEYIPELKEVNKDDLGIVIIDTDGRVYESGDSNQYFTIQSISKVISLLMCLQDRGVEYLRKCIGVEATSRPFSGFNYLEGSLKWRDFNPMVNIGALCIYDWIEGPTVEVKTDRCIKFAETLLGCNSIKIDQKVYNSECEAGDRNRAMAYLLRNQGFIKSSPLEISDMHFKMSSMEVTCRHIAHLAAILSNKGKLPNGERVVCEDHVTFVNALLTTCGMYDGSGNFCIDVGLPAKSGVSGGLIAVAPKSMGIGVYSPALDEKGNTLAGMKLLKFLSHELKLSMFE
jgi:glutaminase